MLIPDIRNHTHHGSNNVRGIQAPPETHLNYPEIHSLFLKILETHPSEYIEETQRHRIRIFKHLFKDSSSVRKQPSSIRITDLGAVYLDTFIESLKMRRSKQSNPIASSLKNRGYERRCGALAVGSSHMNGFEAILRVSK